MNLFIKKQLHVVHPNVSIEQMSKLRPSFTASKRQRQAMWFQSPCVNPFALLVLLRLEKKQAPDWEGPWGSPVQLGFHPRAVGAWKVFISRQGKCSDLGEKAGAGYKVETGSVAGRAAGEGGGLDKAAAEGWREGDRCEVC